MEWNKINNTVIDLEKKNPFSLSFNFYLFIILKFKKSFYLMLFWEKNQFI